MEPGMHIYRLSAEVFLYLSVSVFIEFLIVYFTYCYIYMTFTII